MSASVREAEDRKEVAPVIVDTSWLNEPYATTAPRAGAPDDKRVDGKGRTRHRRKTMSPSQVTSVVTSSVDWANGDYTTFPDYPCAGDGAAGGAGAAAATPEKNAVANLLDDTPERNPPAALLPLGPLENHRHNKTTSSSHVRIKGGETLLEHGKNNSKKSQAAGRKKGASKAGAGVAEDSSSRVAAEAENVVPQTPPAATTEKAAADAGASVPQSGKEAPVAVAGVVDDSVEQDRGRRVSRKSRRRSIVMPSEANTSFLDDENKDGDTRAAVGSTGGAANDTNDTGSAGLTTKSVADSRKSSTAGEAGGKGKKLASPVGAAPTPTAISATSCLRHPLAAQRGWKPGPGDDNKTLMRAYYAAPRGSQQARRAAARLFCVTGYCLLPVTPDDARVLCEAAGDSLDWGLDDADLPELKSQARRRKTREQKRELVLRIKPLFDLIEQNAKAEKLALEKATGIVSKKTSPDGYRYENQKTGERVDAAIYKDKLMEYVQSVGRAKRKHFAAQTANCQVAPLQQQMETSSCSDKVKSLKSADARDCTVEMGEMAVAKGGEGSEAAPDLQASQDGRHKVTVPGKRMVENPKDGAIASVYEEATPKAAAAASYVALKASDVVRSVDENSTLATPLATDTRDGTTKAQVPYATGGLEAKPAALGPGEEKVAAEISPGVDALGVVVVTPTAGVEVRGAGATARAPAGTKEELVEEEMKPAAPEENPSRSRHDATVVASTYIEGVVTRSLEGYNDCRESMSTENSVVPALSYNANRAQTSSFNATMGGVSPAATLAPRRAGSGGQRESSDEAGKGSSGKGDDRVPSPFAGGSRASVPAKEEKTSHSHNSQVIADLAPRLGGGRPSKSSLRKGCDADLQLLANPTLRPASNNSFDNHTLQMPYSQSMQPGSPTKPHASDPEDTIGDAECHTSLMPLSMSPLCFPVKSKYAEIPESEEYGQLDRDEQKVGVQPELKEGGNGDTSRVPRLRPNMNTFVIPNEFANVPVEEHAALKAELDAIEDSLLAEIEAVLQRSFANRALAISRRQRPTHQAMTNAGAIAATAGYSSLAISLAKRGQACPSALALPDLIAVAKDTARGATAVSPPMSADLVARNSEHGPEGEGKCKSAVGIDDVGGDTAAFVSASPSSSDSATVDDILPKIAATTTSRTVKDLPPPPPPPVSPPEPQARLTSPSTATAPGHARTEEGQGDDAMVSLTPSSPLSPLLDLRLSEDDFLGSSSLLGLDDDDEPGGGGVGISGGGSGERSGALAARGGTGKVKMDRRSLSMAFYSSSQWGDSKGRAKTGGEVKPQRSQPPPKRWADGGIRRRDGGRDGMGATAAAAAVTARKGLAGSGNSSSEKKHPERGESGRGVCTICCKRVCDAVLRPCDHAACSVCTKKLREQAEKSGNVFCCPWDRVTVSEVRWHRS